MPELPEAEYMVRRLAETPPGERIEAVDLLRPSILAPQAPGPFTAALPGDALAGYSRVAKNVLLHLESGHTLRIQLGMTGHVYRIPRAAPEWPRFTRLGLTLSSGAGLVFEDARVLGRVHLHTPETLAAALAHYGPDPLSPAFTPASLATASRSPIKPLLLDQCYIAGLGNIWAAESLFAARLHPATPAAALTPADRRRLHRAIRRTLEAAIANTFTVTRSAEEFPEADLLRCAVYGRAGEPCRRCRTPILRFTQAARTTFYCPHCQPPAA